MTQENKELLLKDLCARLPYGVIVNIEYSKEHGSSYRLRVCSEGDLKLNTDLLGLFIQEEIYLKPYLRPMSSMTEEERNNLRAYCRTQEGIVYDIGVAGAINCFAIIDFLNAHHFDYRGLIEKGLALVATANMYHIPEIIKKDEPIDFSKLNNDMYNEDGWMTIRDGLKMDRKGHIAGGLKLK